jgi:hypothetical protein
VDRRSATTAPRLPEDGEFCPRHDRMFRYTGACGSNEKCRRLWVPAPSSGFCAPMVDWAVPMPEDRSLALATRSDGCCRRTLHGINGVVDRMQGTPRLFDRFRRHRTLHGATPGAWHGGHCAEQATWRRNPPEPRINEMAAQRLLPLAFPRLSIQQVNANTGKPGHLLGGSRQAGPPSAATD